MLISHYLHQFQRHNVASSFLCFNPGGPVREWNLAAVLFNERYLSLKAVNSQNYKPRTSSIKQPRLKMRGRITGPAVSPSMPHSVSLARLWKAYWKEKRQTRLCFSAVISLMERKWKLPEMRCLNKKKASSTGSFFRFLGWVYSHRHTQPRVTLDNVIR